jgi:hypothetical protein
MLTAGKKLKLVDEFRPVNSLSKALAAFNVYN